MKRLPKVNPMDFKYMKVAPDPDFDPERNRRIIAESIKKNEARRRKNLKEHEEQVRERSAALATYLKSLSESGRTSDIKKYFGRKELARLRGEEILARITDPLIVRNADGRIIRKQGDAQAHN